MPWYDIISDKRLDEEIESAKQEVAEAKRQLLTLQTERQRRKNGRTKKRMAVDKSERYAKYQGAYDRRMAGATFKEIADENGISVSRARGWVYKVDRMIRWEQFKQRGGRWPDDIEDSPQ